MTEQNATDLEHVMVMCRIFVAKVSFPISGGSLEVEHVILLLVVSKSHRGKGGRYFSCLRNLCGILD